MYVSDGQIRTESIFDLYELCCSWAFSLSHVVLFLSETIFFKVVEMVWNSIDRLNVLQARLLLF